MAVSFPCICHSRRHYSNPLKKIHRKGISILFTMRKAYKSESNNSFVSLCLTWGSFINHKTRAFRLLKLDNLKQTYAILFKLARGFEEKYRWRLLFLSLIFAFREIRWEFSHTAAKTEQWMIDEKSHKNEKRFSKTKKKGKSPKVECISQNVSEVKVISGNWSSVVKQF